MKLQLLADDYKQQYENKLLEHKDLKKWLDGVGSFLPKCNLLLSLASHEEANMCWWDAAAVNFFVLDSEVKDSTFNKTYAFLESS